MINPPINRLGFYDVEKNQRVIKIEASTWVIIYKPPPIRIITSALIAASGLDCIVAFIIATLYLAIFAYNYKRRNDTTLNNPPIKAS